MSRREAEASMASDSRAVLEYIYLPAAPTSPAMGRMRRSGRNSYLHRETGLILRFSAFFKSRSTAPQGNVDLVF